MPVLLAVLVDQRLAQLVGPGADHLDEARLDRPHVVAGDRVLAEADDVVDAREARLAQLERPVERHPAERLEQDPADPLAVLGVEAVARDAHQALHEPLERVSPQEQPQPLALAEPEDPDRQVVQLLGLHLEQRVARVGLEDLEQRLAVVAGRREPGALQHAFDLAADDRDLARARLVRGRRVQPEEAALADHLAVVGVPLDADVVEVRRPVDGRGRVGLGQQQDLRLAPDVERLAAQRLGRLGGSAAQDPEPRAVDRLQPRLVALVDQVVLAVAEEREVVVDQPVEERLGLLDERRIHAGRRVAVELVDQRRRAGAHLLPVLDRGADLGQHPLDRLPQLVEQHPIVLAPDLDVDDRFADHVLRGGVVLEHLDQLALGVAPDPDHRVDHQVDPVPEPPELHRHRVDDERHVVGDDLDQRVRRLPPVLLEVRVVDPHLRLARLPVLGQVPVRDRGAVQVERVAVREVLGRDPLVVLADERLARRDLAGGQALPHAFADRVDQLGLEIRPLNRHVETSSVVRCLPVAPPGGAYSALCGRAWDEIRLAMVA